MKWSKVLCAWLLAWLLALVAPSGWSDPTSTPAAQPQLPLNGLVPISEELVFLSGELLQQLQTQEQTVIDSKVEFVELSQPLLADSSKLKEGLETVSTSLEESTPLLSSSETGFETSLNLKQKEVDQARLDGIVLATLAGLGGLFLGMALF